ncbi:MAG: electron transport complex subunit RsxG [Gammaproteobacteria bacterium]|nr:electron transport complex subunit RsxG [Gammaproteobacteria bacterium]
MMHQGKQILVTGLLLMLFATIGTSLVGITYETTAEKIADNERRAMLRSLNQIIPPERYNNDLISTVLTLEPDERLGQKEPSLAYLAKKDATTTAVIFSVIAPDGYSGAIKMLIGINADASLAGVRVVSHKETPGLGDVMELKRSDWILGFNGKSLDNPDTSNWKVKRDGGEFDQFTGATITPRAVVKAVHHCLLYFSAHKKRLLGTADE